MIKRFGGLQKLVRLLHGGKNSESAHRALLGLRILTEKEADRHVIMKAGGIGLLAGLL